MPEAPCQCAAIVASSEAGLPFAGPRAGGAAAEIAGGDGYGGGRYFGGDRGDGIVRDRDGARVDGRRVTGRVFDFYLELMLAVGDPGGRDFDTDGCFLGARLSVVEVERPVIAAVCHALAFVHVRCGRRGHLTVDLDAHAVDAGTILVLRVEREAGLAARWIVQEAPGESGPGRRRFVTQHDLGARDVEFGIEPGRARASFRWREAQRTGEQLPATHMRYRDRLFFAARALSGALKELVRPFQVVVWGSDVRLAVGGLHMDLQHAAGDGRDRWRFIDIHRPGFGPGVARAFVSQLE